MLAPLEMIARGKRRAPVSEGALYRRTAGNGIVETARVLSIGHDVQGIQHVRFRIHISRDEVPFVDEERMLNVETFAERFGQPVEG